MTNRTSHLVNCLVSFGLALATWSSNAAEGVVTSAMAGQWEGNARIIVSWCQQTNLSVVLTISTNGSVTGTVGDATLVEGRLERNRGKLGRKLNLATDYIIRGKLNGSIVGAENITREGVSIPLNFRQGTFTGGVHTTGSKFGGKDKMILSAASLTLARPK
jgi:hypothetical protein